VTEDKDWKKDQVAKGDQGRQTGSQGSSSDMGARPSGMGGESSSGMGTGGSSGTDTGYGSETSGQGSPGTWGNRSGSGSGGQGESDMDDDAEATGDTGSQGTNG